MKFKKYLIPIVLCMAFAISAKAHSGLQIQSSVQAGSQSEDNAVAELRKVRDSFVNTTIVSYSPSDEVTRNFLSYSENGRASIDVLLMQLYLSVLLPQQEVERVMALFDYETGQWKDIDYTDMHRGEWDMTFHITRIYALAKSYKNPESPFYMSKELGILLHKAAGWWFTNKPVNPNWWHNDIGVPKKLAAAMILLRDELSQEEIDGTLYVLERSKFGRTGQNKAWLAGNQLMKALLIENPALAREAVRQMEEEIYVTDSEGIQNDWSFHQHGPQMQFGNYGLAFAEGISFWARALNGTDYAFGEKQIDILENYILNGLCWTVWKGVMDPSVCGRQLHINGGNGKAYSCAVTMLNMAALNRPHSDEFRKIAAANFQPQLYGNELVGARYYPRSDFGVFRAPEWYASMRMQSERTIGYEFTNDENLLAQFSADGVMIMMQSGDEYKNIFPYWDWRKLPGVTAYEDGKPLNTSDKTADKQNNSLHVGAMTGDNEMVTTMEVNRFGLHAFKTSFFFPEIIISLGSDIRREREDIFRITTAPDQNHLDGAVVSGKEKFRRSASGVEWVHHCGKGYVSLDGAQLTVETSLQKGNWKNLVPSYERPDSGMVFKCYFEHNPLEINTYAYAVLPCTSAKDVKSFAKNYGKGVDAGESLPKLLCNTADCQAIAYGGKIYVVAHRAGEYELDKKSRTFAAPGIYIIKGAEIQSEELPLPASE